MAKRLTQLIAVLLWLLLSSLPAFALEGFGVHILHPQEISQAKAFVFDETQPDQWHYVTIPLTLDDLHRPQEWQAFFAAARQERIIPIIRLATRFQDGAWQIPTRRNIVDLFAFLDRFEWPTSERHVIVFNEVNHAAEWGGQLDPASYARLLAFTADWAHSEQKNYLVLPSAMDLAAPNSPTTREAFTYLAQMSAAQPEVFALLDAWNSHSYPNPGFSSSPTRTSQNSVRGFLHELAWLKNKTGRDYQTYITETGWVNTPTTSRWLTQYYLYSLQHVWNNPQVVAVTPFLLKGDPGPFSEFGFLDRDNRPTAQYDAVKEALKRFREQS